jgi:hypothetical protein
LADRRSCGHQPEENRHKDGQYKPQPYSIVECLKSSKKRSPADAGLYHHLGSAAGGLFIRSGIVGTSFEPLGWLGLVFPAKLENYFHILRNLCSRFGDTMADQDLFISARSLGK